MSSESTSDRIEKAASSGLTDVDMLVATGVLMFGERWQSPLASKLGVDRKFIGQIVAGDRPMPNKQRLALARICHEWLMTLGKKKFEIERLEKAWRDRSEV